MKFYVSHSSNFDYINELYRPLNALIDSHELVLPHELDSSVVNTKDIIKTCDAVIAEVSYPSTGQGIELGWANQFEVPIICVFKTGKKYSESLKVVSGNFIEYGSTDELIERLKEFSN